MVRVIVMVVKEQERGGGGGGAWPRATLELQSISYNPFLVHSQS